MTKRCDKDRGDALPKYMYRRKDGRSLNYYVRLVAPTEIQPYLDKKDLTFRQSTGTADFRRAKVIGADIIARKLKEWDALRKFQDAKPTPVEILLTKPLIAQIAGARLQSWLATDNRARLGEDGLDDDDLAEIVEFCADYDKVLRNVNVQKKGSAYWESVKDSVLDWCLTLEYDVSEKDPQFLDLVHAFAKSEIRAQQFIAARNRGDAPDDGGILQRVGTCLSAMNAEYVEFKSKTVGPKPVSMAISIWNRFIAFKGDVFLDDVTSNDIYQFFESRLFTDKDPWSQKYVDGHAKRSLKEIFALARTRSFMSADNPMSKLEMTPKLSAEEAKKRTNPRFAFSSEQINTLLSSEWYIPDSTQFRGKLKTDLAVRYFGPLIGLLHGTRVREFLQLMTNDVSMADGILCFKFQIIINTDDEIEQVESASAKKAKTRSKSGELILPKRTLKNESVIRTIPVHPKLIALGFDEYVEERRRQAGNAAPLFESSVPTPGGKTPMWGRAYEQSFLRYVRDTLEFGSGFGSHSFRHQFEDRIRHAQGTLKSWPAGMAQLLSGRQLPRDADRDIFRDIGSERDYGNGYRPSAALPYINTLNFDDIRFPESFLKWSK